MSLPWVCLWSGHRHQLPGYGAGLNPARSTGIALAAMNEGLTQNPLAAVGILD